MENTLTIKCPLCAALPKLLSGGYVVCSNDQCQLSHFPVVICKWKSHIKIINKLRNK